MILSHIGKHANIPRSYLMDLSSATSLAVCGRIGILTTASGTIFCFCCGPRDHPGNHGLILKGFHDLEREARVLWGSNQLGFVPISGDIVSSRRRCIDWFLAQPIGIAMCTRNSAGADLARLRVALLCELDQDHSGPHQRSHQMKNDSPIVIQWD